MQVLGLCRFSYPAIGGFRVSHDDPAERARFLYHRPRLEERFRLFESFTLPSLQAQTDPDFTFVVVTGDDLPEWAHARLTGLLARLPQAVHRAFPPGVHRGVMQAAINGERDHHGPPSLQFRLDDDDAVSRHFVADIRTAARDVAGMLTTHRMLAIDFNHGHVARPTARGIEAAPVARSYWAPGLAMLTRAQNRLTVMNFNHSAIWKFMPTLTFNRPHSFVRGLGDSNDSQFHDGAGLTLLDTAGEDLFRAEYGICADRVREICRPAT